MSNPSTNVKKVLFVDDNLQFLEMIERLMGEWSKGEWQIFLAQNAGKALIILQEHPIDLAVVDVQMPVVDGIQFLALINRKYPNIQKVTLSAYSDDASRAACISHGAELFLEKPRDPADLEIIFATLRELARHKPAADGFRGVLRQVSLQDVVQMECLNRNTSILEVKAGALVGQIFIKEGSIIHAQIADRNGEAALNKILCLTRGEFSLRPFTEPPRQTIDGPWEFLVMEAARARDEGDAAEPESQMVVPAEPILPMPKPAPPLRPPTDTVVPPALAPVSTTDPKPASNNGSTPAAAPNSAPFAGPIFTAEPKPAAPATESKPVLDVAPRPAPTTPAAQKPASELVAPRPPAPPAVAPRPPLVPVTTPATTPKPAKSQSSRPARVEEMVVCADNGDVLYEWQSANSKERVSLLEFLSRKSLQLGQALSLGEFDRLEIEGGNSRVVARVKKDRGVFMRASNNPDQLIT